MASRRRHFAFAALAGCCAKRSCSQSPSLDSASTAPVLRVPKRPSGRDSIVGRACPMCLLYRHCEWLLSRPSTSSCPACSPSTSSSTPAPHCPAALWQTSSCFFDLSPLLHCTASSALRKAAKAGRRSDKVPTHGTTMAWNSTSIGTIHVPSRQSTW